MNLRAQGLWVDDEWKGLDWEWLAIEGATIKAPPGGEQTGRSHTDRGKLGTKLRMLTETDGVPVGLALEGADRHDKKAAEEHPGRSTRHPRPRQVVECLVYPACDGTCRAFFNRGEGIVPAESREVVKRSSDRDVKFFKSKFSKPAWSTGR